mgnify:CR=1 FL=1
MSSRPISGARTNDRDAQRQGSAGPITARSRRFTASHFAPQRRQPDHAARRQRRRQDHHLRAICNMVRSTGAIEFDGKPLTGRSTENVVRLGIAHVPQGRGTFTTMTVEENLQLGAITRNDKAGVVSDIERMYEHFPVLKQRHTQQAGTLSGGEQQMLAVARALMLRPRLMLLDEPSFGLAPLIVRDLFKILGKINREDKVTILVVEQNAQLALELADKAYVIETGRIVMSGKRQGHREQRRRPQILSGLLRSAAMELFTNQVLAGIATGAIYACMALAVVMIYQAIDHLNFAQGEMAMFSTFVSWQLMQWGVPYWGRS